MAVENNIYGPEVLISPHTSRPIDDTENNHPIFWCGICNLQLPAPAIAIQHMGGRPHKVKANKDTSSQNNRSSNSKRKHTDDSSNIKLDGPVVHEPAIKKSKEQVIKAEVEEPVGKKGKEQPAKAAAPESKVTCDDCNIEFPSSITAIQHFKGKRHASTIAQKLALKQKQNDKPRGGQSGGRGQAGRGQAGMGQAGMGQAGRGQAGMGQAGRGQAGMGQAGMGQAGRGQAGMGQAGMGQAGRGQEAGRGQAGRGQTGRGQAQTGTGQAGRGQAGRGQAGRGQTGRGQTGRGQGRGDSLARGRGLMKGGINTGGFVRGGVASSVGGVPVGGQYGNYIPTPDVSSSNFLPVGKKTTLGSGVGLLSDYFVNASSRKDNKSDPPTLKNFDSNPSINYHQSSTNDFSIKPLDNNEPGNNRVDFRRKPPDNKPFNEPKNERDDFLVNSPNNLQRNELRNDRDTFTINPPDNLQYNEARDHRDAFYINTPDNLQHNAPRNDRGGFQNSPPRNMQYNATRSDRGGFHNNSPGKMQDSGPRNDFGVQSYDFSTPSNYGTLQHQSNDYPMQPKEYFASSNLGSQKSTFSGEPRKDIYDNNFQLSPNDSRFQGSNDHSASLASPKGNFSGVSGNYDNYGTSNYSSSNYTSYNYSTPTAGNHNNGSNNYSNSNDSFRMNTDARQDSFYNEPY